MLIELVIVLLIISILAVVAVFSYSDYLIRSRVAEGLTLASVAQLAVEESVWNTNALPATQADTQYIGPSSTDNVVSIAIANDGTGEITITYTTAAGGGTIILTPVFNVNTDLVWTCTGGTLSNRYRPAICRL